MEPVGVFFGPKAAHEVPLPIDSRCVEELSDALLAAGQIDSTACVGADQHAIEPPANSNV